MKHPPITEVDLHYLPLRAIGAIAMRCVEIAGCYNPPLELTPGCPSLREAIIAGFEVTRGVQVDAEWLNVIAVDCCRRCAALARTNDSGPALALVKSIRHAFTAAYKLALLTKSDQQSERHATYVTREAAEAIGQLILGVGDDGDKVAVRILEDYRGLRTLDLGDVWPRLGAAIGLFDFDPLPTWLSEKC